MLQSIGLQRVRHDLATEQQQQWKKSKTTQTVGEIYHVLGLEESILWKWLSYPKQSTDSMQSILNYQWHFFTKLEQNILIYMETQQTTNTQRNLEKEKQSWRDQAVWLQILLQNYSHQNSMVLAGKQIYRSMEQDRVPRNKPMHLCSINLSQRRPDYTMVGR